MLDLVAREVSFRQTIGKQRGLAKGKAEAHSGDGVHPAGSVANQSGVSPINALQGSADGDGSAFGGCVFGMAEMRDEFGKVGERSVQPQMRIRGDQRYTNFFAADGSDIDLAGIALAIAPVQFHEVGPGRDAIMPAESEAEIFLSVTIKARSEEHTS